jgi:hypothetical protein
MRQRRTLPPHYFEMWRKWSALQDPKKPGFVAKDKTLPPIFVNGGVGWEMEFAVADPDRAAAAVVRRLVELGASAETTIHQSGPEPRIYHVRAPAGGSDAESL